MLMDRDALVSTLRERYDLMDLPSDSVLTGWDREYSTEIVDSLLHHVLNTKEPILNPYGFIKVSIRNWKMTEHQQVKRKGPRKRDMPQFMQAAIENIKYLEEPYVVKNMKTDEVKVPDLTEDVIQWAWKVEQETLNPELHMKFFWIMVGCNQAALLKYEPSYILRLGLGTSLGYERLEFGNEEI